MYGKVTDEIQALTSIQQPKQDINYNTDLYNLRLEKKKTFIKTKLKNKNCTQGMYPTYEKETVQELIKEYGYSLVVDCMIELLLKEEKTK